MSVPPQNKQDRPQFFFAQSIFVKQMSGASVKHVGDRSTHAGPELVVTGGCVLAIVVRVGDDIVVGAPVPSKVPSN